VRRTVKAMNKYRPLSVRPKARQRFSSSDAWAASCRTMNGRLKKISSASKSATPCFSQFLPLLPSSHSNPVHSIQAFMYITIIYNTLAPIKRKQGLIRSRGCHPVIEEREISRVGRRRSWTGANCSAAVTQDVHTQCWGYRSRKLSELMVAFLALDKTAIEHKTRQSGCCSNLFTFACAPTTGHHHYRTREARRQTLHSGVFASRRTMCWNTWPG